MPEGMHHNIMHAQLYMHISMIHVQDRLKEITACQAKSMIQNVNNNNNYVIVYSHSEAMKVYYCGSSDALLLLMCHF